MDVIAAMTVGRGGRFKRENGRCEYIANGKEPRIVLFSRTGLPFRARPLGDDGSFAATSSARLVKMLEIIKQAREVHRKLDFEAEIWPSLKDELRSIYQEKSSVGVGERVGCSEDRIGSKADSKESVREWDIDSAIFGTNVLSLEESSSYEDSVIQLIRLDLDEARQGFRSPRKYALEFLLYWRELIRSAVNFSGLTATSHEWFYESFSPMINRNVIGPQIERAEEMLALKEAGVLSIPMGPRPKVVSAQGGAWGLVSTLLSKEKKLTVDHLICAHVEASTANDRATTLLNSLRQSGRVRAARGDCVSETGIEITTEHNVVGSMGKIQSAIFAVGPICEGSTYYNHYVPTTQSSSTPFIEAELVVSGIFKAAFGMGLVDPNSRVQQTREI